jgi:type IV pilus assembly protein PilC
MEKTEAIKSKIKSALMYPISVVIVAFVVVAVIMIFVIPAFKSVFSSFGADLAGAHAVRHGHQRVLREVLVADLWWHGRWLVLLHAGLEAQRSGAEVHGPCDAEGCQSSARWLKSLHCALDAHAVHHVCRRRAAGRSAGLGGRRAGNSVYSMATERIQQEVSTGTSLTAAMTNANLFPTMVLQMCAIGEESGSIDHMLGKAADFYEAEVDDMVAGLSSLMEPIIIVFLGTLIGGIVVSMYLPIFKLGQVV